MFPRYLLAAGLLAAAFAACTRVEVVGPPTTVPIAEGGAAGEGTGGQGSSAGEQAGGEAGAGFVVGGAPGVVELGLWPTYAARTPRSDGAAVVAAVSALSAGSRTLPVHERWDELSSNTGSPRAVTWQRLDAMVQPYRERAASVALCIDIVDRTERAWPTLGELDESDAREAIESTIDEVYARYAGQLTLLCFGYEVDRYLAGASKASRTRLLTFLRSAVKYASSHLQRSADTAVGVAVTLDAVVSKEAVDVEALELGDAVVGVYDPLDAAGDLKTPTDIAGELSDALDAEAGRDDTPRPLVLFEAGYPSAAAAGSSEQAQRIFFTNLLEASNLHADALSFVGIFGLDDRASASCVTEAPVFGTPADASPGRDYETERAAVRCSMGLRAESSQPKQAWPVVLGALSAN